VKEISENQASAFITFLDKLAKKDTEDTGGKLEQFIRQHVDINHLFAPDERVFGLVIAQLVGDRVVVAANNPDDKAGVVMFFDRKRGRMLSKDECHQIGSVEVVRIPGATPSSLVLVKHRMVSATSWNYEEARLYLPLPTGGIPVWKGISEELIAGWNAFKEEANGPMVFRFDTAYSSKDGRVVLRRTGRIDFQNWDEKVVRTLPLPAEEFTWDGTAGRFAQTVGRTNGNLLTERYCDFATPIGDWCKKQTR
jgi:hypothetical protein